MENWIFETGHEEAEFRARAAQRLDEQPQLLLEHVLVLAQVVSGQRQGLNRRAGPTISAYG
jgi:hypothetical protein